MTSSVVWGKIKLFPERFIICGDTSVQVTGIKEDVQFCVALKPKFIKHVLVPKIVKVLADVVSVNVNNCVTVLYTHPTLKVDVKVFIAVAKPVPEYNEFGGI